MKRYDSNDMPAVLPSSDYLLKVHTGQLEWMQKLGLVLNSNDLHGATCSEKLSGVFFPAAGFDNE